MKMRWMRWLFGLFGAMWLLITGVLWTGRPPDGQIEPVLLSTINWLGWSYALAIVGDAQAYQLTPLQGDPFEFAGWSADGKSIYLTSRDYSLNEEIRIFRTGWADKSLEFIDTTFQVGDRITAWSPDHEWMVYLHEENNQYDLIAHRVGQSEFINLTHGLFNGAGNNLVRMTFSSDHQWVYFIGPVNEVQHLFRVRIDGSDLEDLTPDALENVDFRNYMPEYDIYIVVGNGFDTKTILRSTSEGIEFQPLPENSNLYRRAIYLPERQMLLFETYSGMSAIETKGWTEWWKVGGQRLSVENMFVTADESTIYYFDNYEKSLKRINWDGTGQTTLLTFTEEQLPLSFDPHKQILLYLQTSNGVGQDEIWQHRLGKSPQRIAAFPDIDIQGYSPDRQWIIFQVPSQSNEPYTTTYRIHPDGTGLERILNGPSWWYDVVAFGPKWELQWQPPIHAILGATLLVISLLRWPKVRHRA